MKNLLALLLIFTCIVSTSLAQNILNSGFEDWHPYASGEYPDNWTTDDSVSVALLAGNNVFKGTDSYEGTYCMHLKSVTTSFGITGPGIATNGIMSFSLPNVIFHGGMPDTARSQWLTGQYKYSPKSAADQGFIKVLLLRDSAGIKDTVADGVNFFTDTVDAYSPFTVALTYHDYRNKPDTALIIIQSSMAINDPNLAAGTELIIDSLNLSGFVGINEVQNAIHAVNIFPSPANKEISIDVELNSKVDLVYEIYDISGRKLLFGPMNTTKEKVDVSNLSSGQYILKLSDGTKSLYSSNFQIAR